MTDITIRTTYLMGIDNAFLKEFDIPYIYNGRQIGRIISSNPDEETIVVRVDDARVNEVMKLIGPQPRLKKIVRGE